MRSDGVGDVQQRQAHLRRDVVGHRLGQGVGGVLLTQPLVQVLVEPPGGTHRHHDHLEAPRIEQDPPQLLEIRHDEVDQCGAGPGLDLLPQRTDGGTAVIDQLGDDGGIGFDGVRSAAGEGALVREGRDEVAAVEEALQGVPDQRIGSPQCFEQIGATRRCAQHPGDIDEQSPTGLRHGPPGRQLPEREAQGLHRVRHHLLMTDRHVDVVVVVAGCGDGEQRGDRPALDDLEPAVVQAPFDVLRATEVGFDPPAQFGQLQKLGIGQGRLAPTPRLDRQLPGPASRYGVDGELFGADRPSDDLSAAHPVDVRVHPAVDQRLAEAEAGLDGDDLPVGGERVGREQDPRHLREHHRLHDAGHRGRPMVAAVLQAVHHGTFGEERGPAPADVPEHLRGAHDVQEGVVLTGERGGRQVFGGGAGTHGARTAFPQAGHRPGNGAGQVVGDGGRFDGPADPLTERADRFVIFRAQPRQLLEELVDRRHLRHDPPEGVGRHAETGRHADALDPPQSAELCAFAPDDLDRRLPDLLKPQHVGAHPSTSPSCDLRPPSSPLPPCDQAGSAVWRALSARYGWLRQGPHLGVPWEWRSGPRGFPNSRVGGSARMAKRTNYFGTVRRSTLRRSARARTEFGRSG